MAQAMMLTAAYVGVATFVHFVIVVLAGTLEPILNDPRRESSRSKDFVGAVGSGGNLVRVVNRPVSASLGIHRLSGMSGINILGRLLLPLGRHFGGIRFSEHSARPELIPLDIILGQARFAVVELSSRTVFQI
jgi:hypothetical protein